MAVKRTRYERACSYAAVEPATGGSVALLAPNVNANAFNVFLTMLAAEVRPDGHVVLTMGQTGWHRSRAMVLPECVTAPLLPSCSPELSPADGPLPARHVES